MKKVPIIALTDYMGPNRNMANGAMELGANQTVEKPSD